MALVMASVLATASMIALAMAWAIVFPMRFGK